MLAGRQTRAACAPATARRLGRPARGLYAPQAAQADPGGWFKLLARAQQRAATLQAAQLRDPVVEAQSRTSEPAASLRGGLVQQVVVRNRKGFFRIRHFQQRDLLPVANLQASCFFEPLLGLSGLNRLGYTMFRAEVLDGLKKKAKALDEDGFALLVVESCQLDGSDASLEASSSGSSSSSSGEESDDWEAVWYGDSQASAGPGLMLPGGDARGEAAAAANAPSSCSSTGRSSGAAGAADWPGSSGRILGVIEVGVQDEADVLRHLAGVADYAYVSSMAVSPRLRRCGVGAALLAAAEQQAARWGQRLLALHVYPSNEAAMKLYTRCGMHSQAQDPAWKALIGGKVRQLMIKPVAEPAAAMPRQ